MTTTPQYKIDAVRLVDIYNKQGRDAASDEYSRMTQGMMLWVALALKDEFAKLLKGK